MVVKFVAVIFLGYLLGAIPFGLIATRLIRGIDIREYGSGKTGVTNVLRTAGKRASSIAVIGDAAKGAAAVLFARFLLQSLLAEIAAALAAIVGHNWSIYIKFQGGRGVTTFFGGLLAMYWPAVLICGGGVLGITALTRYFSLGSIVGVSSSFLIMLPLAFWGKQPIEYLIYTGAGACLILFQHRDNIQRLRLGTERKLGEEAKKRESPLPTR
jgi:glycerol-3-phosphate acyltransferase PlsY